MIAKCLRKCWDSGRSRQYYPGDQDDINPLEPIAMYFEFPPGTEVYHKESGTKNKAAKSTTRIIPGLVDEKEQLKTIEKEESALLKRLEALRQDKEVIETKLTEDSK